MSTAVMPSATLFDMNDYSRKQQQHQHMTLQTMLSSSPPSSSGCSSWSRSSCSSGDLSKDWEPGSPPDRQTLAAFDDFIPSSHSHNHNHNHNHRKLERTQSEPANSSSSHKQSQHVNASRYKTELCRPYEESGSCKYGDKCQFAHGEHELRGLTRHPKYKTEPCRTFHTVGFCPYGPRCHFIHNADETRRSPPPKRQTSPVPTSPFTPPHSPPPQPPLSPDTRLPVFNRISAPTTPLYAPIHFGELLA